MTVSTRPRRNSTTSLRVPALSGAAARRPAWRQRLVDIERGAASGFRGSSSFFVHLFFSSVVFVAGMVLGLSAASWTALVLALTIVLTVELFQHALKIALEPVRRQSARSCEEAIRAGAAAVFVSVTGATVTVLVVFGARLSAVMTELS